MTATEDPCGAAHPDTPGLRCTLTIPHHATHLHRQGASPAVTWPNEDYVEPLANPLRDIKSLADQVRKENLDRATAGARSSDQDQPYNGSSGANGYGSTSQQRADDRDESGLTARFHDEVEAWVLEAREYGRTWAEGVPRFPSQHHGSISGALSVLHKTGRLVRLAEQRDGCEIYVGPDFVDGRRVVSQGNPTLNELDDWLRPGPDGTCRADGNEVAFKEAMRQRRVHLYG